MLARSWLALRLAAVESVRRLPTSLERQHAATVSVSHFHGAVTSQKPSVWMDQSCSKRESESNSDYGLWFMQRGERSRSEKLSEACTTYHLPYLYPIVNRAPTLRSTASVHTTVCPPSHAHMHMHMHMPMCLPVPRYRLVVQLWSTTYGSPPSCTVEI